MYTIVLASDVTFPLPLTPDLVPSSVHCNALHVYTVGSGTQWAWLIKCHVFGETIGRSSVRSAR